jgi:hypothetical protein
MWWEAQVSVSILMINTAINIYSMAKIEKNGRSCCSYRISELLAMNKCLGLKYQILIFPWIVLTFNYKAIHYPYNKRTMIATLAKYFQAFYVFFFFFFCLFVWFCFVWHFSFSIRYFFYLHFKCYSESSLYPRCTLLPYPPTPTSWPWRSPVLGHIKFTVPNDGPLGHLLLHMQIETQALRVLVSSYSCSTYRVADPFSSLGAFSSFSIVGPVFNLKDDCERPLLYLPGIGIASYETAISGSLQQSLAGICNSVWVWWLIMGWIPGWDSLWIFHPFVLAPYFVSVIPFMSMLFPNLRRNEVSTSWSSLFLIFLCFSNCFYFFKWKKNDVIDHKQK